MIKEEVIEIVNEIRIEKKQPIPFDDESLIEDGVIMFIDKYFLPSLKRSTDDTFYMHISPAGIKTWFTNDKKGDLVLNMNIHNAAVQFNHRLRLSTEDKIAILTAINKDNNRIKALMEHEKTKEHQTDSLKPYYDAVRSKEVKDGIEWSYIKDGNVVDTAFMSYKELYEIQIGKKRKCQFCDCQEVEFIMPRDQATGIYLCKQHLKYIQRISQKQYGKAEEV